MKKIILGVGVLALAAVTLTSCHKSDANYSAEDVALGDSIANAIGNFAAANQLQQMQRMQEMDSATYARFNKDSYLRGIQAVLESDTADIAYMQGLQMGMQLMSPIMGLNKEAGIPVNSDKVIAAFKEVFAGDSADIAEYYGAYNVLMTKVRARVEEKQRLAKENSPEAKENLAAGQKYLATKAAEAGYVKAESGIVYKVLEPGTGDKVKPTDRIKIFYKGRKINGEVFDETHEEPYSAGASAFVPGFSEALTLVGKGGKVTVVIPAELAYGVDGAGNAIGPNETLEFDIEVVDVVAPAVPANAK